MGSMSSRNIGKRGTTKGAGRTVRRVVARFGHQLARLDDDSSKHVAIETEVAGSPISIPPVSLKSWPVVFQEAAPKSHPPSPRLGAV
jgi:hypothetical protein